MMMMMMMIDYKSNNSEQSKQIIILNLDYKNKHNLSIKNFKFKLASINE